jgi:hypothetical protein
MGGDTIHRLHDMEVEEVSLVDRPANKRPFLVVKRSTEMGAEVIPDGNGGFTTNVPTVKLELPKGMKEGLAGELEKLSTLAGELGKEVGKAKEVELEEGSMPMGLPQELTEKVEELKLSWGALQEMLKPPAPEPAEAEGGEEEMPGAAPAPPSPAPTEMAFRDGAVEKAIDEAIAKVGRKMSKDRLDRFRQALSVLFSVMNELAGEEGAAPVATPGAPQTTAPRSPADVAARAPALSKAEEASVVEAIGGLTTMVRSLVAKSAEQDQRIEAMSKARQGGNALPVEGSKHERPEDVSWPLDMNRPIDRETVSKQEFFD